MEQVARRRNKAGSAMSTATTMRRPICAEDPEEIFQVEARLLADYATAIERDVLKIAAKFPGTTGTEYVEQIGENISDETLKAAVKKLAAVKFWLRGMAA
jgi:hypothetical protein